MTLQKKKLKGRIKVEVFPKSSIKSCTNDNLNVDILSFVDSMILLGSVQRYELERIIYVHLSYDQKIVPQGSIDDLSDDELSETSGPNSRSASRPTTPPPFIDSQFRVLTPKSRFHVSKVDDIPLHPVHGRKLSLSSSVCIFYLFVQL